MAGYNSNAVLRALRSSGNKVVVEQVLVIDCRLQREHGWLSRRLALADVVRQAASFSRHTYHFIGLLESLL